MGVSVRDLLNAEAFKNFELVAGHGGLDNHIQGIAVMDAPDAFQWAQGRELLITTGYVFYKNPDLLKQIVESGDLQKISAFAIKLKRYIHEIPEDVKAIFDEYNIPLISIPFEYSWMNIMNQLNVHVMNQNIRQFNIRNMNLNNYSDRSYQVRKIHKILSAIEKEMKFPAMLYDITNKKAYYSSPSFSKQTDHLRIEDFWDPSFNVQKVTLCNNLNMTRFRSFDQKFDKPYSWITVPISVDNKILAYFVVVEATGLIDFFDQFALRIGFILLQSLFEQMLIVQTLGDQQFEKFISDCLSGNLFDLDKIEKRANNLQIDINQEFYYALIKQTNNDSQFSNYKGIVKNIIQTNFHDPDVQIAMVDENNMICLIPKDKSMSNEKNIERIKKYFKELYERLTKKPDHLVLLFGIVDTADTIYNIKRNYERCEKTIKNGAYLLPTKKIFTYSELGVFAWLNIQEDEIDMMLNNLKDFFEEDENKELIETLKAYLDCNLNYSRTAKKLYVHVNTVRNRIEQINDRIQIDLDEPFNRLKLEILLNLFN